MFHALLIAFDEPVARAVWGVDLVHHHNLAVAGFAEFVLGVHQNQASIVGDALPGLEEQVRQAGYNIHWINKDGAAMQEQDWHQPENATLGWMLESVVNAKCVHCLLTLFNSGEQTEKFALPAGWHWVALLDTATLNGLPEERYVELEQRLSVQEKSMIVLYGLSNLCDLEQDGPTTL